MDTPPPGFVEAPAAASDGGATLPPGFAEVGAGPARGTQDTPEKRREQYLREGVERQPLVGLGESALSLASQGAAALGGGLTYLGTLAATQDPEAASAVQQEVGEKLTYHPRSPLGKATERVSGAVGEFLGRTVPHAAGEYVYEKTGSPTVATVAETATAALPMLAGGRAAVRGQITPEAAEGAAREYVGAAGLDWSHLPDAIQGTLRSMAQRGEDLRQLDPRALQRVARAQAIEPPVPLTRGEATRDVAQLTTEENLRKSEAGAGLRERQARQDVALHESLENVRKEVAPGSTVKTSVEAGAPVQAAARRKLQVLTGQANRLYNEARKAGALRAPVPLEPLEEWMNANPANRANAGWVLRRAKQYANADMQAWGAKVEGPISINNLELLRQELNAKIKEGGTRGHYAGEAKKVVDSMLDSVESEPYQKARGAWKAMKEEFSNQRAIRDLTSEKAGFTDRRIALEQTTDYVLRASRESLDEIKATLTKGGTEATRTRGARAWADLQAGVIAKLRETAAGRQSAGRPKRGELGQMEFDAKFLDAFDQLDRTGKLQVLFGEAAAKRLRTIAGTVEDVRTAPSARVRGSDTVPKLLNVLEHFVRVPMLGAAVKGVTETVQARRAQRTPVDEAAAKAAKRPTLREYYRGAAGAAGGTQPDSRE